MDPLESKGLLIRLRDWATRDEFSYSHEWKVGDLVIWDNLATMHRGTRFDDGKHRRELRRVTSIDVQYEFENLPVAETA